jgi:hypothetical protein
MKYFIALVVNILVLAISVAGLLSTCMWGCPNTGIQLSFKISTVCLLVSLGMVIYLWITSKSGNKSTGKNDVS